uniref:WAP domain-containing protein n=1 Tax=Anas platyrhynchos platyrhynchos TaxID=8840 RepID=A0A493TUL0_ANAPP
MGWDGDGMGWDGMGWDGMGWDGMGWDGVGWGGMGWDGMGWDGMGYDRTGPRAAASPFLALQGRPASAQPARGCSPATTAGSGASKTPTAPARRNAACVAVTPCACTQPEVGAARHPAGPPSRPPGPPSRTAPCLAEKPGICPLTEAAPWTRALCQASCAEDGQCPGDEKCCSSRRCGRVCLAPERDKPGQCPKVRPRQAPEPCTEEDACGHDRDCPRQEKCCFGGCAMRCTRPAREHPGECPWAEPCGDPQHRHRSQCLDDSACRRDEKCCSSGCAWACVAVAVPGGSGEHSACWAATHQPCSQLGVTAGGCARREPGRSPRAVRAGV